MWSFARGKSKFRARLILFSRKKECLWWRSLCRMKMLKDSYNAFDPSRGVLIFSTALNNSRDISEYKIKKVEMTLRNISRTYSKCYFRHQAMHVYTKQKTSSRYELNEKQRQISMSSGIIWCYSRENTQGRRSSSLEWYAYEHSITKSIQLNGGENIKEIPIVKRSFKFFQRSLSIVLYWW